MRSTNIIKLISISAALLLLFMVPGCNRAQLKKSETSSETYSEIPSAEPTINTHEKKSISGAVQKGPYLNGTSLTFFELNEDFGQTGKNFIAQIESNTGEYNLNNIVLSSDFVLIRADGFYFNEVDGETSSSSLTLYALSDISNRETVNVNLISNLEKDRVLYLIENGSITFEEAKTKAQKEILNIFSLNADNFIESESLNIAEDGENNAILLAISVILQGYRTTGELSELIANISTDIRTDGMLNDSSLGMQIISDANLLNLQQIRKILEERYQELGMSTKIPNFEKYINFFINNTSYVADSKISYPQVGEYGENILGTQTEFHRGDYSIAADLLNGASLIIKLISNDFGSWYFLPYGNETPWEVSEFTGEVKGEEPNPVRTQIFSSIETRSKFDIPIGFEPGEYIIEYYENGNTDPTYTKSIIVNDSLG